MFWWTVAQLASLTQRCHCDEVNPLMQNGKDHCSEITQSAWSLKLKNGLNLPLFRNSAKQQTYGFILIII